VLYFYDWLYSGFTVRHKERTMDEKRQILFMQIRIFMMASKKFGLSLSETSQLFRKYDILRFIRELYGLFHLEGDEAIFEDVKQYLKSRGAEICNS